MHKFLFRYLFERIRLFVRETESRNSLTKIISESRERSYYEATTMISMKFLSSLTFPPSTMKLNTKEGIIADLIAVKQKKKK